MGRDMERIMDVHSHILTKAYKDFIVENHGELEDGFALPDWDAKKHMEMMEECGIDFSIVSVSSPHPYYGDEEACIRITRAMNEESAKLKVDHPDKFGFFASLPLPSIEASVQEIIYADEVLHANGVKLPSNCRGIYLGNPVLDPVFEELNRRSLPVVIHPHKPSAVTEGVFSYGPVPLYEFLCDTTRTVLDLMSSGVLERYPNIKVVVPHCGSFLPNILKRFRSLQPILINQGLLENPIDIDKNMENLYFDLAGNPAPDMLPLLLTITTPDKIMYGGDFPFTPVVKKNLQDLLELLERDDNLRPYKEQILHGNAEKLFGLKL
ncbi:amidohydrolase family protein [Brotaphodocola sp.]|uniref:amidohydrolase family protein n=1 Tax=Brotaphodocola sp. TaxID=3073577 RepID=UPI003D7C7B7D